MTRALRWGAGAAFAGGLAVWTFLLLEPNPVPDAVRSGLGVWDFLAAKSLHVAAYLLLTAAGQLAVPRRFRVAVALVMLAHGAATEAGQTYVPNRHGCVQDVLIDAAGVAAGTFVLWLVTRGRPAVNTERGPL